MLLAARCGFPVTAIAWSPDERFVATASTDVDHLQREAGTSVAHLLWSSDGKELIVGSEFLHVNEAWDVEHREHFPAADRLVYSSPGSNPEDMRLIFRPRGAKEIGVAFHHDGLKCLYLHPQLSEMGGSLATRRMAGLTHNNVLFYAIEGDISSEADEHT